MLEDEVVDNIQISWRESEGRILPKIDNVPPNLSAISNLLDVNSWDNVLFFAEGVGARHGRSINEKGFRYPDDADIGDEPLDGALVYDYFDRVVMSEGAFNRLMSRFFQALIAGAQETNDPVIGESWWGRFLKLARAIE